MLIGIDASKAVKQFKTGTETYSIELIKALSKIDSKNQYLLYAPTPIDKKLPNLKPNFHAKILPFSKFWTQIRFSWEMLLHKPDILFIPAHTLPLFFPKKSVITIHDLGFKHYPELYPPADLLYHNWAANHSIKRGFHILTDSEFTKKDILENYVIDPSKISVVWLGYDVSLFRPSQNKSSNKPYIFYVGRLEEKKNIIGMIKAYAILRQEKKIKHQFILAGRPGYGYEKIKAEINALPKDIQKDIVELGYINQEEYVKYLKNADILFFCTFFEGFGLPLIEAMASGIPVVASNTTCIPEICGKAAQLANPKNPFEMAATLSKVINDEGLKRSLISKGIVRASLFSWEKTAQKTLTILQNL
ncbi:MAG: Glycosyl transferase, group 1 [Berkelbacteria bacterium GW2011_GWB1_38_5]|uniref:Glycosyl transferase, group 1 n=1 Tax=Berkelbacteria bacterium GW2011_GWB1_38_5 TaxID=1618336 RepID=A0A0G0K4N9_9BACT|nr:MAG: Glycosyl transferase, group 1 [Berkelbacteria bacterium GW2011_GWB1_38_5]